MSAERAAVQLRKIPTAITAFVGAASTISYLDPEVRASLPKNIVYDTLGNVGPSAVLGTAVGHVTAQMTNRYSENSRAVNGISTVAALLAVSALNIWFESRFGAKFGPFDATDMNRTDFTAGVVAGNGVAHGRDAHLYRSKTRPITICFQNTDGPMLSPIVTKRLI